MERLTADSGTTKEKTKMGTDLEMAARTSTALTLFGVPPSEMVQAATEMATNLAEIINRQKLYTTITGRVKNKATGQYEDVAKKYVHLEGWQTLGSMLGVTAIVTRDDIEEVMRTNPETGEERWIGYRVYAVAQTLDGRVIGGAWSECTSTETRGPWSKAESHALLGMAQTRAMSRALKGPLGFVMKLAGYDPTPAEEMEIAKVLDGATDPGPDWGDDPDLASELSAAARAARAVDPLAWSNAKIRARLSGATEENRRALLAELNEWLDANAGGQL